ncbi:MAG: hypothetical protein WCF96_09505 [Eubacteriales bacterium]
MTITAEKITSSLPNRFVTKTRQGVKYRYDNETGLFENTSTGKWVHNPIIRSNKTVSTLRYYWHPDLEPILNQITQDPYMIECIGYLLKFILVKNQLRKHINKHHTSTAKNQKKMAWLSHEFSKRILGESKYKAIMFELVEKGILNQVVKTNPKGKIYLYSFSNPVLLQDYSLKPITFKRLEEKILNYRKWALLQYQPLDQKVIAQIIKTGWKITITEEQLKLIAIARYKLKYLPKHPDKALTESEYMDSMNNVMAIINNWNDADEHDKLDFFTVDDFGNRLHHVFTYLPSEIRAYVQNREGVNMFFTQYDLANSQPAIMANLLVKDYGFTYNYFNHDFVSLVCRQKIYEDLALKMNISRDISKTEMLNMLYSWLDSVADKNFQKFYPDVSRVIRQLKMRDKDDNGQYIPFNKRHAQLPKIMQQMESLIFRDVWRVLINNGNEFLPIHDAVYVAGLNSNEKTIMEDLIFSILKQSFSIPIEVKREEVYKKS